MTLALAAPAAAQAPNAVTGPNVIFSPANFWSNPQAGRFYNPASIKIGTNFFMYVHGGPYNASMGGPGSDCSVAVEQILIFETPNTHDNIRSTAYGPPLYCASGCPNPAQGAWTYQGHANPCVTGPGAITHHYQLGSVFLSSWDGQYKLLVDETDGDASWPDGDFKRVLLLTSSDGIHWAPQANPGTGATPPLLAQSTIVGTGVVSVGEVSMTQGLTEWWGTFAFGGMGDGAHARIRVFQSSSNVRGYVAYIWSNDSLWHKVNDDGTFSFMPADVSPPLIMNKITLVDHLGAYEAWGVPAAVSTQPLDPIDPGCSNPPHNGSILEASIAEGTADTTTPPPAMGTPVYVTSSLDTNSNHTLNWPLATQDSTGRLYPLRFDDDWGKYLLYSSSLDAMCWSGLLVPGTWRGIEILLTVVDR